MRWLSSMARPSEAGSWNARLSAMSTSMCQRSPTKILSAISRRKLPSPTKSVGMPPYPFHRKTLAYAATTIGATTRRLNSTMAGNRKIAMVSHLSRRRARRDPTRAGVPAARGPVPICGCVSATAGRLPLSPTGDVFHDLLGGLLAGHELRDAVVDLLANGRRVRLVEIELERGRLGQGRRHQLEVGVGDGAVHALDHGQEVVGRDVLGVRRLA